MNSSREKLEAPLNELTRKSTGHLLLMGAVTVMALAWMDPLMVPPESQKRWLVIRSTTAAIVLLMRLAVIRTKSSRYTKIIAYLGAALCIAAVNFMNYLQAHLPSDHLAAPILITAALCFVTWSAWNTFIIGTCIIASWLWTNFATSSIFDAKAFSTQAGYLSTSLLVATAVSYVRQKLMPQDQQPKTDFEKTVEKQAYLIKRTAHDIRSPLAAMSMVCEDPTIPEAQRLLMRSALTRVNDIANSLVTASGGNADDVDKQVEAINVSPLLHSLISEKRTNLRASGINIAVEETNEAAAAFCKINKSAFSRAISNLLNNAAESMSQRGTITVKLRASNHRLTLSIIDQGCGIAPENIAKVLRGGTSLGKVQGSGLGLASSSAAMRQWGGDLTINSEVGKGTTIQIELPRTKPAPWFAETITVEPNTTVIVLDDDTTMIRFWQTRFAPQEAVIDLQIHTVVDDFLNAVQRAQEPFLCLVDVKLGPSKSGMEVVARANLWAQTIFVTSQYDDPAIQARCISQGSAIVPKPYAARVPIVSAMHPQPPPSAHVRRRALRLIHGERP